MRCSVESCGKEILSLKGVAYAITGWDEDREAGGTNHVLWRRRTGALMCAECVTKKKQGVSPGQGSLV